MIVADANVVVSCALPAQETELALALLSAHPDWIAPPLVLSELRSVMLRQLRGGLLGLDDALDAYQLALDTLEDVAAEPETTRVLHLANASGCSSYDCEYVALAEQLDCPLATFDRHVITAFPAIAAHPRTLVDSAS